MACKLNGLLTRIYTIQSSDKASYTHLPGSTTAAAAAATASTTTY